jgi:hypothetical protein
MVLEKATVSLPYAGGLSEKKAEKHLELSKLDTCDNAIFEKSGEIKKRNGFTRLSNSTGTGTITSAKSCASFAGERLVFDGNYAYGQSTSGSWVSKGRITGCVYRDNDIVHDSGRTATPTQISVANGYRVEAWAETDAEYTLGMTSLTWHIYARVVDVGTSAQVVGRTRLTSSGLSVTIAHSQDDESCYLNPQVQTVEIDGYIYILFSDCDPETPSWSITEFADAGSTQTRVSAANHGFVHGDTVIISGTSGAYDGSFTVSDAQSGSFVINASYAYDPGTGTATFSTTACKVFASVVNTNSGISSSLTPTQPSLSGVPEFYLNGTYPLFVVDKVSNTELTEGAAVFKYAPNTSKFRLDLYEESGGDFQEWLESSSAGYRGRNTPITSVNAYFQAQAAGYSAVKRAISHIALKSLDDSDRLHVLWTAYDSKGDPWVMSLMYSMDSATPAKVSTPQEVVDYRVLASGSTIETTGTATDCIITAQTGTDAPVTDDFQAADHEVIKFNVDTSSGTVSGQETLRRFSTMTTDLFEHDGKRYFGVACGITPTGEVNFGSSQNLIADIDGNIVAAVATGTGGSCIASDWCQTDRFGRILFTSVQRVHSDGGKFTFGTSRYTGMAFFEKTVNAVFSVKHNSPVFNPSVSILDMSPRRYLPSVEAGGSLLLGGGLLWEYGGDKLKESGFLMYPQVKSSSVADVTTVGGAVNAGTYRYRVIYEWTGRLGNVQRSYPSDFVSVTVPSFTTPTTGAEVTITAYTPQWTQKRDTNGLANVRAVLYRTTGEAAAPGSIYHRCASKEVFLSSTTVVLVDELKDVDLERNEQIYSSGEVGSVYGNLCPPSQVDITVHKNRVFAACVDGSVWYSKKFKVRTGIEFSEFQTKRVESDGDELTALAPARESLVIFTAEDAYYIAGDGVNSSGQGVDFTTPAIFARNQGAPEGAARASTNMGIVYESGRGIYLINNRLEVQYIGAEVEDTVSASRPIAVLQDDSKNEIYFPLEVGSGEDPQVLVFNYYFGQWSKWILSSQFTDIVDAMMHKGKLALAHTDGFTSELDNSSFVDAWTSPSAIQLKLRTAWIKPSMFLAMSRFWRLLLSGTFKSDHTLHVTMESDYDSSLTETKSVDVNAANGNTSPYRFRLHIKNQKARAIRFEIYDVSGTSPFEGYSIDGFALELGMRKGTFKGRMGTKRTLGAS